MRNIIKSPTLQKIDEEINKLCRNINSNSNYYESIGIITKLNTDSTKKHLTVYNSYMHPHLHDDRITDNGLREAGNQLKELLKMGLLVSFTIYTDK